MYVCNLNLIQVFTFLIHVIICLCFYVKFIPFISLFMLNLSLCLYASLHAPLFHDVVLIPIFCDLILSSYPYSFYFWI